MPRSERVKRQVKRAPRIKKNLPVERESPAQRLYLWRLDQLERAGMPRRLAKKIADSEFDLHTATDMLAAGCSPELLLEIAL